MKFSEDISGSGINFIRSYDAGGFVIGGKKIDRSIILAPDQFAEWEVGAFTDLAAQHLAPIYQMNPEIILLGTGARHLQPDKEIQKTLARNQTGFEIMHTQAACRTYNVLVSEGRRVVAGLLIIDND